MSTLNSKWKALRWAGTILQREDSELTDGWYTVFWLKEAGPLSDTWVCEMKCGEVISLNVIERGFK